MPAASFVQRQSDPTHSPADVGGSAGMQQTYMSLHGLPQTQNTVEVDGLNAGQTQLGHGRVDPVHRRAGDQAEHLHGCFLPNRTPMR